MLIHIYMISLKSLSTSSNVRKMFIPGIHYRWRDWAVSCLVWSFVRCVASLSAGLYLCNVCQCLSAFVSQNAPRELTAYTQQKQNKIINFTSSLSPFMDKAIFFQRTSMVSEWPRLQFHVICKWHETIQVTHYPALCVYTLTIQVHAPHQYFFVSRHCRCPAFFRFLSGHFRNFRQSTVF